MCEFHDALALDTFNATMNKASSTFAEASQALVTANSTLVNANNLIADPQLQKDLRDTAAALPKIAQETRDTIAAARASMQLVSQNLDTIQKATLPIAGVSKLTTAHEPPSARCSCSPRRTTNSA